MMKFYINLTFQNDIFINYHFYKSQDKMQEQKMKPSSYFPFSIPPSLSLCLKHRTCSQFGQCGDEYLNTQSDDDGKKQEKQKIGDQQTCPCCEQTPKKILPLSCKIEQIYDISQPVGFYFTYIKIMCAALFIVMLVSGIYTLVEIFEECGDNQCKLYVYGIPIPKIDVYFRIPLIILNGAVILILYIFLAILFFKQAYLHQKNICHNEKPSDYSILLSGIEHSSLTYQDLKDSLSEFNVAEIIFTHKVKKYLKELSKKSLCQARHQMYSYRGQHHKAKKMKKMIQKIDDKLLHVKNKMTMGKEKDLRTDKVIITFADSTDKKNFEQNYKLSLCQNIYHSFCGGNGQLVIADQLLYIQPLGEPNELIWQNFQIKSKNRYLRVLISNLLSLLILFGSFVIILFLSKSEVDEDKAGAIFLSILFAVLIEVVNTLYNFAIQKMTDWEGRYTLTGKISIKLYKNCFGYFLNTTLLPFLLFLFRLFEPSQQDLIRNIFTIFLVSNLISPFVGLYVHPRFLYRLYQRRKIKRQGNLCIMTQIQANRLFEKIDFMLDERYAIVTQIFMNCMFYAAVFPIGIVITIAGMLITYWSSKAWLLNYCSLPRFTFRMGRHINKISCVFPCVYAFGYAANLYMVQKNDINFNRSYSIYMAVATIPLSLFFFFFGQKLSRKWIFKHRSSVIKQCMNKAKPTLEYKKLNPTSFIHDDLIGNIQKQEEHQAQLWKNLVSYMMAKQSGALQNVGDQSRRSSRQISRLSASSSSTNKNK